MDPGGARTQTKHDCGWGDGGGEVDTCRVVPLDPPLYCVFKDRSSACESQQKIFIYCDCFYRPHPKDGKRNSFSLFVSSHPGGGGRVPTLAGGRGTYLGGGPTFLGWGCTYLGQRGTYLGWGGTHLGQASIGITCYVAGGMPLAFTQEDCLVANFGFTLKPKSDWGPWGGEVYVIGVPPPFFLGSPNATEDLCFMNMQYLCYPTGRRLIRQNNLIKKILGKYI